jgi:lysozyme
VCVRLGVDVSLDAEGRAALEAQLMRDEGLRLVPYTDTAGKLTIGYGRNLTDVGITEAEARALLAHDLVDVEQDLAHYWPWAERLSPARYGVLANMVFNLGAGGAATFVKMLRHLEAGEYEYAADAMLDSRWAQQTGDRAQRLAQQMRSDEWV